MNGKKIFAFHSILGLITGALLLVIGLSGSVLVFSKEIDQQINPTLVKVAVGKEKTPLDNIYSRARSVFPDRYIRFRNIPQATNEAIELSVEKGEEWLFAYFDPYTGKYLGSRNAKNYFLGWLLYLHYSLLGGQIGELVVELLAVALVLSVVTGFYIYRKQVLSVLTFKVGISFKNRRRTFSSLHRVIGVWSLVFNLLFAITGFWMLRYVFMPATYGENQPPKKVPYELALSLDSLKAAIEKNKSFTVTSIFLPQKTEDNIILYGFIPTQNPVYTEYVNNIEVDGITGHEVKRTIITEQPYSVKWDMMAFPLHAGVYGNIVLKIIYCIAGTSPALLSISGFFLWLKKKKRK